MKAVREEVVKLREYRFVTQVGFKPRVKERQSYGCANIRGGFAVKVDELATVLQQNNVDIACITETFLNDSVPSEVLHVAGYIIHRNDRKNGRRCGGVAVLVRRDIPCQRLTSFQCTDVETLWMLYRRPSMPRCLSHVIVGAVYCNQPSADRL